MTHSERNSNTAETTGGDRKMDRRDFRFCYCFAGSGTTLLVADRLGRDAVGIELNPEYAAMCQARIRGDAALPGLAEVETVAHAQALPLWDAAV